MEEVPCRTSLVPLAFPLVLYFVYYKGGKRRAFRLPGKGGDHFHCTVEPPVIPSSQKQLQAKKIEISGFWIFSLLSHESESERKSLGF